jgi:hypothetical protein
MRKLALLAILAALVIPALAQADHCPSICEDERQQCMASQCPTQFYCEECEQVYSNCMSSCQEPGCIPPGGVDDVLYETHCCSGAAVPGSTCCADPADWYDDWESCTQICA